MKTITQVVQNLVKPYIDNQDQAVESNIAPVETDATSSTGSYSQGEQLILNKILYDVTAAITVGDPLEVGTNIAVAPKISAAIGGKQEQIEVSSMPTASASNVGKVLIYIGATTSTYTSGQSYQSTLEDGNYIWKPTSISSVDASDVVYDNQTSGLTATDSQAAIDELASQNQTLTNNVDVLIENGAINLLPIKCPNQTENNVTLTNNNDGSVTISGTASANTYFYLLENSRSHLEIIEGTGKSYTLSGCTSGSGSTYALRMLGSTDLVAWYTVGQIQTTEEMTFTEGAYPYYALRLDVFSGASVNVTIKPMLVDSKYKGAYQPYAKTNKELTEELTNYLVQKDYNFVASDLSEKQNGAASFDAGAIGTRGCRCIWDISDEINSGLVPISSMITDFFDSNLYFSQPCIDINNKIIKLDIYRSITDAVSNARTQIRITYAKKNFMTT